MSYSPDFFRAHAPAATDSARQMLPVLLELTLARSIVDVGCGVGAWLKVARELGVSDVRGVDGPWVKTEELLIPREMFEQVDLAKPFATGRRYDLAMSLEVGEHLPESSAAGFVDSITKLTPLVAFSAAIPQQGGTGHVNEQWPGYWAALFAARGYQAIDCVRERVWEDGSVAWWYAQNTIVYGTDEAVARLPQLRQAMARQGGTKEPRALVHPGCFVAKATQPVGLKRMIREFPGALAAAVKARGGGMGA
jgi:SAM-dependent methyltransferase